MTTYKISSQKTNYSALIGDYRILLASAKGKQLHHVLKVIDSGVLLNQFRVSYQLNSVEEERLIEFRYLADALDFYNYLGNEEND